MTVAIKLKAFTGCSLTCPECKGRTPDGTYKANPYASHQVVGSYDKFMCGDCAKALYGCPWKLGYGQVWDQETNTVEHDSPLGARR